MLLLNIVTVMIALNVDCIGYLSVNFIDRPLDSYSCVVIIIIGLVYALSICISTH